MFCYIKLNKIYILGGTSVCSRGPNSGTTRSKFCGGLFSLDVAKKNTDMPVCGKLIRVKYLSINQFFNCTIHSFKYFLLLSCLSDCSPSFAVGVVTDALTDNADKVSDATGIRSRGTLLLCKCKNLKF